jgi:hypothetical protein
MLGINHPFFSLLHFAKSTSFEMYLKKQNKNTLKLPKPSIVIDILFFHHDVVLSYLLVPYAAFVTSTPPLACHHRN